MGYWGKIIGGVAGFAMGGPFGAVVGAALGHAADNSGLPRGFSLPGSPLGPARIAALFGRRDELFAISVVVLSAKLAKCDGPVVRAEIDAFKRHFRIPPESARDIGRLFDEARDSRDDFAPYAKQLGESFADNRGMLEEVLVALFAIGRADAPINQAELGFLAGVHRGFGLDRLAWDRVRSGATTGSAHTGGYDSHGGAQGAPPRWHDELQDPYSVLGVARQADNETVHQAWRKLMRENHPDSLASRGVPAEFIARATAKVARINAAWDQVKRERGM
jgi:DnaJ like chaperone protein